MEQPSTRTRTNIEIDDQLLNVVMRRYNLRTKTEAVDIALSRLAGLPLTTQEILGMQGSQLIGDIPPDTGLHPIGSQT
ncbi:MAG: type II toxin-antitoxin system VapB family antitoxin [Acidimicrobiia bacterium]|uniref:type II toxin-antitoxin system VapB family antitoxin n=1 Tax=Candidatus Poriferisocius sp. TaxID=3101276 RepID=UPI0013837F34|nr:type II toxin-antitoxin system VapB family antitoxin [bacterium]MXW58223.1 type II toxin-antitoxin system VapB family antitoxin [Acidimicrobiia bacterium]MXZ77222.1 type II toxin-antitoxin system VapB family antitoxin [Acidimicrobiia bacterium]MYB08998.1 type II toxin-antitoxin system VapB family antitoxin [Acidimicrobiia bacterium]MYB72857.1 type II toxin-antitoxin system VapB family antitoxin [Acidimicrobiia bacterium]